MADEQSLIVQLSNVYLTSDRGEPIFSNLNFELAPGQAAVITGGAGSGKTCLVEMLVGRRATDEGAVEVFGQTVNCRRTGQLNRLRRKIGGVGGIFALAPAYTVAQNVAFPLVLNGERSRLRREKLMKTLADFSLLKQAAEYPAALTRVEYTLALFARASIASQPMLLVDEPLAGLDWATYDRMFEYLLKVTVSGRSMIILSADGLSRQLPNSTEYCIANGGIQPCQ